MFEFSFCMCLLGIIYAFVVLHSEAFSVQNVRKYKLQIRNRYYNVVFNVYFGIILYDFGSQILMNILNFWLCAWVFYHFSRPSIFLSLILDFCQRGLRAVFSRKMSSIAKEEWNGLFFTLLSLKLTWKTAAGLYYI